jgi:hypothetical protein
LLSKGNSRKRTLLLSGLEWCFLFVYLISCKLDLLTQSPKDLMSFLRYSQFCLFSLWCGNFKRLKYNQIFLRIIGYRLNISSLKIQNTPKSKTFWHDTTSGKFYTWPHVMGHSQNVVALKMLCKITFRIYISIFIYLYIYRYI